MYCLVEKMVAKGKLTPRAVVLTKSKSLLSKISCF